MLFVLIVSALIMAALYAFLFFAVRIDRWLDNYVAANSSIYPNEPIRTVAVDYWSDIKNIA